MLSLPLSICIPYRGSSFLFLPSRLRSSSGNQASFRKASGVGIVFHPIVNSETPRHFVEQSYLREGFHKVWRFPVPLCGDRHFFRVHPFKNPVSLKFRAKS